MPPFPSKLTIQAIKQIRENHNIVGTPIGTLLQLPTQNLFLGAPFEYSPEEIALLNARNDVIILDGVKAARRHRRKPNITFKESPFGKYVEFPKEWQTPTSKGEYLAEPPPDPSHPSLDETDLPLSKHIPSGTTVLARVYEFLHRSGYWMTPGLRFGCEYTAYPGDPLRFHSHFMVHVQKEREEVDMLSLVGGGRVATTTRKAWMLAGEGEDGDIRVFSIEWAGFG